MTRFNALLPVLLVLVAIVAATPSVASAAGTWSAQTAGTTESLDSVVFTDANLGWAVGQGGLIIHTLDGGAHWTLQTSGTTADLSDITFVGQNIGWAVGGHGEIVDDNGQWIDASTNVILATTDGGEHWTTRQAGAGDPLSSVAFADVSHGWAVGGMYFTEPTGYILATSDGGAHWTPQAGGATSRLIDVTFTDAMRGWAVGLTDSGGVILATTDGGSHWTTQTVAPNGLYSVSFSDAHHGWAVGQGGLVSHTIDGGSHWTPQTTGVTWDYLSGVAFTDASHGWAVGDGGILSTTDGGAHWAPYYELYDGDSLHSVAFTDANHGWAVGGSGTILAYTATDSSDLTPPTTTSNAATYYASSATIHLTATDNAGGSGVAHTYYTLNGGAQVEATSVTKSTAGSYTLAYWSVDVDGNVEAAKTVKFTVIAKPSSAGTPSTPAPIAALRHGKSFTVYGYIIKHTSGTYPVTLRFYRYQSGHWVLRKSITAKASSMLTFSKYSRSTSVPYSGKWRVRARHKVGTKYLYSGYRYFTAS